MNPTLVNHFLENSAERLPDKIALVCGDQRISYAQIDDMSEGLAQALAGMGMRRQDRVVIFLENSIEAVAGLFGVLKAGGIFIMLNPAIKSKRLRQILNDCGAIAVISHVKDGATIKEAVAGAPKIQHVIWVAAEKNPRSATRNGVSEHLWSEALTQKADAVPAASVSQIDIDLAAIIYTSGSTGEPKGVMSAHYNMVAVARSVTAYLKNTQDDIILSTLPLAYGYGLYQVLTAFMSGGTVVLEPSFVFPYRVMERMVHEKVTGFPIVPTIAAILLQMKDLNKFAHHLRYITNAAAALPVPHIRRLMELLPNVRIFSMYGLTECQRVSYMPPEKLAERPHSVGIPIPNCEVLVVDEEGREVRPGQVGELVVRGANVMQGYWNSPEETAQQFRPGTYRAEAMLHTGDLFRRDEEGYLYFVARKDDMIKTKGERVSPKEVENVICEIDGVLETAVVGVPDEILGQAVKAFVVCNGNPGPTINGIQKRCKEHLEPFMVPKWVEFRDALPRTSNGKIDKKLLM